VRGSNALDAMVKHQPRNVGSSVIRRAEVVSARGFIEYREKAKMVRKKLLGDESYSDNLYPYPYVTQDDVRPSVAVTGINIQGSHYL